ncbi:hypothetical protein CJ030_MR5G023521 [Morella rubra]|uniref:Uncharacterized protein n=1 Tax=Morella rubra TaxID=262757 RepID=A0A6A1VKX0_9ROSI|nr:hypothetical protein CJ030_MR5G023521 [Morella rubra]
MSSSRPTRSSQRTPASVGSKGKKKARTIEEPTPTPEDYIYKSGLCKNRFVQDFQNRKVIAGRWVDFQWFNENEFGFQEMFEFQGWGILVNLKAATEKKRQGLPCGIFFTHMFHILDIDLGGEVWETPKASKEYNQKTLRLMGFTQNVKEEQKKLGQQLEKLSLDMKMGFDDIKQLFAAHDERFNLLDKDVRLLKHQVNNSIHVAAR